MDSYSSDPISEMFNAISPTYDKANRLLSLGIDKRWRRALSSQLPKIPSIQLLDLATGTCDQILSLMKTGKIASATGIDLAKEMLVMGQKKVDASPFSHQISLKVADALATQEPSGSFDCITMAFGIRNVSDPMACLKEMHRLLKLKGRALILEFSIPKNRCVRSCHLFYLRSVLPRVGKMVSGHKEAYRYLNETIESFPHGKEFLALMKRAGFAQAKAIPLSLGIATLYIGESS